MRAEQACRSSGWASEAIAKSPNQESEAADSGDQRTPDAGFGGTQGADRADAGRDHTTVVERG